MDPFSIALLVGAIVLSTATATISAANSSPQELANESEGDTFFKGIAPVIGILGAGAGAGIASAAAPAFAAATDAGAIAADAAAGAASGGIDAATATASAGADLASAGSGAITGGINAAQTTQSAGSLLNDAASGATQGAADTKPAFSDVIKAASKGASQALNLASKQSAPTTMDNSFQRPSLLFNSSPTIQSNGSSPVLGSANSFMLPTNINSGQIAPTQFQGQQSPTTPYPTIAPVYSDIKSKTRINSAEKEMDRILSAVYSAIKGKRHAI